MHWLQRVPKCGDVPLVVVHVGINTCWMNAVKDSMRRGPIQLLKTLDAHISSIVSPQGDHPLKKTVAASDAVLVKAC